MKSDAIYQEDVKSDEFFKEDRKLQEIDEKELEIADKAMFGAKRNIYHHHMMITKRCLK